MPVVITDEMLKEAGLSERDIRVEVACRLFDAGHLSLPQAGRWAGLDRFDMELALLERGLPVYRFTEEDLKVELTALQDTDTSE
ncbi:MAG: UPF0175 family protein [Planctomycetaceae bacterium]